MPIPLDPADIITVPLGEKSFTFRALSFREAKAFRADLASLKATSEDDIGNQIVTLLSPVCTSHTEAELCDLRESELAVLPHAFQDARRLSERALGELLFRPFAGPVSAEPVKADASNPPPVTNRSSSM